MSLSPARISRIIVDEINELEAGTSVQARLFNRAWLESRPVEEARIPAPVSSGGEMTILYMGGTLLEESRRPTHTYTPDELAIIGGYVDAGIDWLDQHGPKGWDTHINLGILNISSGVDCVLGQVYGSYSTGAEIVEKSGGEPSRLGFIMNCDLNFQGAYTVLSRMWREKLARRRIDRAVATAGTYDVRGPIRFAQERGVRLS